MARNPELGRPRPATEMDTNSSGQWGDRPLYGKIIVPVTMTGLASHPVDAVVIDREAAIDLARRLLVAVEHDDQRTANRR